MISIYRSCPLVRAVRPGASPRRAVVGCLLLLLSSFAAAPALAQVSLNALDTPYTQQFDALPASGSATWNNNSTIAGWYHARTGSGTTIVANDGASNSGNLYSYGSGTASDRALGSVGSGNAAAGNFFWGVRLRNNTGTTITSLDVSYVGEQWRNGAATAQTAAFSYLIGAPNVTGSLAEFQSAGTAVATLDFTSPVTGGSAAALNGNQPANRTLRTATIAGLNIPNGTEIMLRWSDPDHGGADHGLSIDEFSVTPHGMALLPALSIDDVEHDEGDAGITTFTFTASLSQPAPAGGVSFDIATANGSATAPSDYLAQSLTGQVIPAGNSSYTFDVSVNGDVVSESDEQFFVNVSNVAGATVDNGTGIGTIVNDDGGLELSIDDVSMAEGNAGTTTFAFTVSLSAPAPAGGVSFDIATANGSAAAPSDFTAVSLTGQTIAAGNSDYTFNVSVNGDTTFEPDETFFVDVTNIVNAIAGDSQGTGTIVNDDAQPMERIHQVQGSGAASPMIGATVTVEGIVVGSYQTTGSGQLAGFFLQEEDADVDADPATSEGIFVYCAGCPVAVAEGQRVRVTGPVSEYFGLTEITASTPASVTITSPGDHLDEATPAMISLPIAGSVDAFYEAREGMRVSFTDTLVVSEYFQLQRYGQIILFPGDRPHQFTDANPPGAAGYAAHLDMLSRRRVILDDTNNIEDWPLELPDGMQSIYHPQANGGFSTGVQGADFFRGGDQVENLTGVLHWSWAGFSGTDAWRIRPTQATPATFTPANPRPPEPPTVAGAITAASVNVLNYFTTIDTTSSSSSGPCGPSGTMDCRGADSAAELARQRERTSLVLCELDADVVGLVEIENDPAQNALNDLIGAVNTRCGGAHPYVLANSGGSVGTDAIRVALIYRSGVLSPVGAVQVDLNSIHNRPPMAQTFDVVEAGSPALGERFTAVVNHFKSKSCSGAGGADADAGDGQACYNARRTQQASRLLTWLNGTVIPAAGDPDVLILGDLNSYANENPITTLEASGYVDLLEDILGPDAYSYLFDGQLGYLDYVMASASLHGQIVDVAPWHINADEVPVFDYNDDIRTTGEADYEEQPNGTSLMPPRSLYEAESPFRASDHDPVLVGLFVDDAADLSLDIIDTPDPVAAGAELVYIVDLNNGGPDAAADVEWTSTLPAGTSFVSLDAAAGWSCTTPSVGAGGDVVCGIGNMPVDSVSFSLIAAVAADVADGTELDYTVTVSSATTDTQPGNNSLTATTLVEAVADLGVAIVDTPDPVVAGAQLTYGITVDNAGPSHAVAASLSDALPAGTTFVSLDAPAGWSCTTPAVGANGGVDCDHASMAPGSAAFTLVVAVDAGMTGGTVLSNTVDVASDSSDPNAANDSATAQTNVLPAPEGLLTIDPTSVDFGDHDLGTTSAPMTVTLANEGDASLEVTALTTANTPFARSGGSCGPVPIELAPEASCTLEYTFAPTAAGPADQTLTITADAPGSGTIELAGNGVVPQADVAVTIDDGRDFVQIGDLLNYVITVSNVDGPATANVAVVDALPPELSDGEWTCTPTSGATCANGTGNTLSDNAVLPAGSSVTYIYSATVQVDTGNDIVNTVTATVAPGVVDPNLANNEASDATANIVVIFRDGFESAETRLPLDAFGDGQGFVSGHFGIDADLTEQLTALPIAIATGETADGHMLFVLEAAWLDARVMLRAIRVATDEVVRGAWTPIDPETMALDFAWQSATYADETSGYLHLAAGTFAVLTVPHDEVSQPAQLRVATDGNGQPWLTMIASGE